jgi:hypothetical protein
MTLRWTMTGTAWLSWAPWIAGLVILLLAAGAAGLRWDPLRLDERRLKRTQGQLAEAKAEGEALRFEREGAQGQAARLDRFHHTTLRIETHAAAARVAAHNAEDAHDPLDAARADRLRAHDRELCASAPGLGGCAPAPDPG